MDHDAFRFGISLLQIRNFLAIFGNDLNDRESEFLCKIEVSAVMSRNTHDGSCPMIRQYIVRDPNGELFPIEGIDRIRACKRPVLFFILHPVHIGFVLCSGHIAINRLCLFRFGQLFYTGMLRRKHEESSPVKRIRPGGKDRYLLIRTVYRKIHFRAIASADPVCLHLLDLFGPVQLVQIVQKSVCISSDFQHPLLQILLGHF